jgi:hypothetical protein
MKAFVSAIFSILISSTNHLALADSEEDWVKVYSGPEITNGDALWIFQAQIKNELSGNHSSCPTLSTAIGADELTNEGLERLDYFRAWFRELKADFDQQVAIKTRKVLCPNGWESWTFDEIAEGLDERGAASAQFHAEDYERTLKVMSDQERALFLRYMQKVKNSSSITKYENRGFYQNTTSDIARTQTVMCEEAGVSHNKSLNTDAGDAGAG